MKALSAIPLPVLMLAMLLTWPTPMAASEHKVPKVQPATSYAAVEVHPEENMAIAAEPYDTEEKESIFRIDYLAHGVMPIRLIVTNNGDKPISLSDARILFQTAAGDRIQAAQPEDVDRMMTRKEREGGSIPLPGPLGKIRLKAKGSIKDVQTDFDQFEYAALAVEPHTTRAGFLFYDVSELSHPLQGAKLHIHAIRNSQGQELFFFEIPFDKYLKSKSGQMN